MLLVALVFSGWLGSASAEAGLWVNQSASRMVVSQTGLRDQSEELPETQSIVIAQDTGNFGSSTALGGSNQISVSPSAITERSFSIDGFQASGMIAIDSERAPLDLLVFAMLDPPR